MGCWREAEKAAAAAIRFAGDKTTGASASIREIEEATGVPYPTVARILNREAADAADLEPPRPESD